MRECPYNAIEKSLRPCENACKVNAIKMGPDKKANIDNEKCIGCGACVYQCPFGAVMDKSYILTQSTSCAARKIIKDTKCMRWLRRRYRGSLMTVSGKSLPHLRSWASSSVVEASARRGYGGV